LITVVLDENREGHAVLTVVTNKGDYVLDNRRMEILRWDQTGYLYLKRQSQPAANEWVSLQKSAPQIIVATKAN
jgi:predicted transglutaminase-like cysteine proteinase